MDTLLSLRKLNQIAFGALATALLAMSLWARDVAAFTTGDCRFGVCLTNGQCTSRGGFCDASNTCVKLGAGEGPGEMLGSCREEGGRDGKDDKGGPDTSRCIRNPSDETCNGQDPAREGCEADAFTSRNGKADLLSATGEFGGTVELRYSPTCQSAWSHVESAKGKARLDASICRAVGLKGNRPCYKVDTILLRKLNSGMFFTPPQVPVEALGGIVLDGGKTFSGGTGPQNPRKK